VRHFYLHQRPPRDDASFWRVGRLLRLAAISILCSSFTYGSTVLQALSHSFMFPCLLFSFSMRFVAFHISPAASLLFPWLRDAVLVGRSSCPCRRFPVPYLLHVCWLADGVLRLLPPATLAWRAAHTLPPCVLPAVYNAGLFCLLSHLTHPCACVKQSAWQRFVCRSTSAIFCCRLRAAYRAARRCRRCVLVRNCVDLLVCLPLARALRAAGVATLPFHYRSPAFYYFVAGRLPSASGADGFGFRSAGKRDGYRARRLAADERRIAHGAFAGRQVHASPPSLLLLTALAWFGMLCLCAVAPCARTMSTTGQN